MSGAQWQPGGAGAHGLRRATSEELRMAHSRAMTPRLRMAQR